MIWLVKNGVDKESLIKSSEENRTLILKKDKCDKYDYLAAVGCGVIGGMIDIFLIGLPTNSVLGNWTDAQVDNAVMGFAKINGWSPRSDKTESVSSAIGHLEKKFKVNYDQRHTADVGDLFNMSTRNHHMMSLSHSPDILGLFFSILNQFSSTSTFIANGQLMTIKTDTFELQGGNFIAKIFSGVANWFGHLMSDIAGSSGSVSRGSGIVMPFYELFGFCKFGKFNIDKDKQDLATVATRAFQEGYDFRFGLTMAIPVIITDLSIRLIWSLRRYFQYGRPLSDCIPTQSHDSLRVMLLFGNGTLCVIDALDAGIRSGGNFLAFFLRLNLIAWLRFVTLVIKEICIRIGIGLSLQAYIDSLKRVNAALLSYLKELEKTDIELFKKETEKYNQTVILFNKTQTDEELTVILLNVFDTLGIEKAWQGSFDEHMSNKNATLTFS